MSEDVTHSISFDANGNRVLAATSNDGSGKIIDLIADSVTKALEVTGHVIVDSIPASSPTTVSTSTDVALASLATTQQLVAANASRKGLLLNNTDANAVYIYYGTTATLSKFTVRIPSNGYWEMPSPIYTGRIDAIWAADGTGSLIGSEL